MIIKVTDTQTANKLSNAMSSGNCIVLYHMHGCPYCVQMMPDWTNFMQIANKSLPGLTIGEVERAHMDKLGDTGVGSFPTIKFYKTGLPSQQNTMNTIPKQNNLGANKNSFHDILKGIMGQVNITPTIGDNSVMFEDNRTTDKLIKFARDNLVNTVSPKGKKAKLTAQKTKKRAEQGLMKAKKTKKAPMKNMVNSLAQLSAENKNGRLNSNMMDLPKYKKAKAADTKIAKKLKKQILG